MGDFYWDSPNRQISPNVADMQRNLMTLGGMGTPTLDPHKSQKELMKDFAIRALMLGPLGLGANIGSSPTTNLTSRGLAISPNVNSPVRGGNLESPIRQPGNTNVKDTNQLIMDILKDSVDANSILKKTDIVAPNKRGIQENYNMNAGDNFDPSLSSLELMQKSGVKDSNSLFHNPRITGITGGKSDIPSNTNAKLSDLFNEKNIKDLNLSHSEKYEIELIKQQLIKKGHDPSNLSMEEIMKILSLTEKD